MSVLIDRLVHESARTSTEIDGRWYIAKPYLASWEKSISRRLAEAWLVLTGRAIAVHYKQDELEEA